MTLYPIYHDAFFSVDPFENFEKLNYFVHPFESDWWSKDENEQHPSPDLSFEQSKISKISRKQIKHWHPYYKFSKKV
ncbi:MAG: hypothetical protein HWD61_12865 [Parachlamydiaceae bacterium]|nr:MAG: hypothetical protein HWD61_12865 [Parachlamydiaceae bacterium]